MFNFIDKVIIMINVIIKDNFFRNNNYFKNNFYFYIFNEEEIK